MARSVRLVNCSLVFLLVIRCIRAPGQRPTGLELSERERGQARTAPLCSRDNYRIGRHTFLTRADPPATATCDAPASRCIAPAALRAARVRTRARARVRERERAERFYERPVVTSRGTTKRSARTFSRNTQPGNARAAEPHHLPACPVT